MTQDRSLGTRIVVYLIVAQLIAFQFAFAVVMTFELAHIAYYRLSLDELAVYRVSNLVIESVFLDRDGTIGIEPNAALRAEMQRAPLFKFAAFDETRAPLPGSSPEMVSALTKAGTIQITAAHLHFNLSGDQETTPLGYMERRRTPFGWLHIAVYRQKFSWVDVLVVLVERSKWGIIVILIVILTSTATAWYAVQKGLAPIRSAARQVETIDMATAAQGVHVDDVPAEIRPFFNAIDSALVRLAASAARMRCFTANAAHELRTPLAVMRARLENASASPLRSDLLNDSSQLRTLVEQMLITVRLSESQAVCNEQIELEKVVQGMVSGFVLLALQRGRKIEFDESSMSVVVRGNRRAVECVVSNLVDNALRAEPEGGTVFVRVGHDAIVEVIDHGDGVALSDREMIFEPFWRKSETTPGTGLGLAIGKELMDKLNGRIWVEETPGGGATFKLSFPRESTGKFELTPSSYASSSEHWLAS